MTIRRLSALLTAVVLLLCIIPAASAAGFSDEGEIRNTEAVTMLTALNVISGFPDGSFMPNEPVTREQAAKMISSILQLKDDSFSWDGSSTFSDSSSWANEYIEYCAQKGIISGYSDGTFDPGGLITADQMFKLLLVAIGNDPAPYVGEQWLENVRADAMDCGLYDNFAGSTVDALNRDDACLLIFNALKCHVITGYADGQPVYCLDDLMNPITMLEYYFDAKMYTEVVTGNEFADLTVEDGRLEKGKTKIAGHKEFDISTGIEFLGRQVNIYISSDGEFISAPVISEQDLVMTFSTGEVFDDYYKLGQIQMSDNTEYYYNYNLTTFSVIGKLDENCTVTVIDRNEDSVIDVMLVTAYSTVTVAETDDTGWLLENGERIEFTEMYDPELRPEAGQEIRIAHIGGLVHVMS